MPLTIHSSYIVGLSILTPMTYIFWALRGRRQDIPHPVKDGHKIERIVFACCYITLYKFAYIHSLSIPNPEVRVMKPTRVSPKNEFN